LGIKKIIEVTSGVHRGIEEEEVEP